MKIQDLACTKGETRTLTPLRALEPESKAEFNSSEDSSVASENNRHNDAVKCAGVPDCGGPRQNNQRVGSLFLRGSIWWTWLRGSDGSLRRVSTKARDEVAAREVALRMVRSEASATSRSRTWRSHRDGDTRVYFIQAGAGGPIKIGVAVDPAARLEMLQCGNHLRLRIVGECDGGLAQERSLHKRFASFRIWGEWFFPADELLLGISKLCHAKETA
jgi:hypothetical protein